MTGLFKSMSTVQTNVAKRLKEAYFDIESPGGYAGIDALEREVKEPRADVRKWLRQQRTYTLHAPARKRFPTRHYQVSKMDQEWQADLVDMISYGRDNRGFKYILVAIDILSRYTWAEPLKSKTGDEIVRAFRAIFRRDGRKPRFIQTDQGTEFENTKVRAFLRMHGIEQFSVKSPYKAAMVERVNRTLKTRMWRYYTHNGTRKWVDILPKLLRAYNHSHHRVLGRTPAEVNPNNEADVWHHLYAKKARPGGKRTKFRVGDVVRLSKVKGAFAKGYLPNWTEEEFIIHEVDQKYKPTMYTIRDHSGEIVEGKFYDYELQRIENPEGIYTIKRILRQRKRGLSVTRESCWSSGRATPRPAGLRKAC